MSTLPNATARELTEYGGLEWIASGYLDGKKAYLFITCAYDVEVPLPAKLPCVVQDSRVDFLIPIEVDLPDHWKSKASPRLYCNPDSPAYIPPQSDDLTSEPPFDGAKVVDAFRGYADAVFDATRVRNAKSRLETARSGSAGLYGSAARIDEATPMLIDGLMRERGVSVVYGDFDEFKTTLVLDMMAHVAMGAPWQGRTVLPRPVIWYALEGADELPARLRALEGAIAGADPAWGNDLAPVTVRDRIPEAPRQWRAEISRITEQWDDLIGARETLGQMPSEARIDPRNGDSYTRQRYPDELFNGCQPVVVIDTLSLALGGEDEKGPRAVGFINECLDLLKARPDMARPDFSSVDDETKWEKDHPGEGYLMEHPVASHIIVIHHQTKTGTDFAGHRAIAANTQGLYRVHRFGSLNDADRPYAGQLTPMRVKGIPRPAPVRFEVEIVSITGTRQTAAILKDKVAAVPKELLPAIAALRDLAGHEAITPSDLNLCLDVVAAGEGKKDSAIRMARKRSLEKLTAAGVIEPNDDDGKVTSYRFHDPG